MESKQSLPVLDCQGCGVCCLHMGFPAFNLPLMDLKKAAKGDLIASEDLGPAALADLKRWTDMPVELRDKLLQVMESYSAPEKEGLDDACVWLDSATKLCRHHEHRPQVCRDFEIGCQECLDWRHQYQEHLDC